MTHSQRAADQELKKGEALMFFIAFAADYDGTLANNGVVDELTIAAVERVRRSGAAPSSLPGASSEISNRFSRGWTFLIG
jgi:hypothetical protein